MLLDLSERMASIISVLFLLDYKLQEELYFMDKQLFSPFIVPQQLQKYPDLLFCGREAGCIFAIRIYVQVYFFIICRCWKKKTFAPFHCRNVLFVLADFNY